MGRETGKSRTKPPTEWNPTRIDYFMRIIRMALDEADFTHAKQIIDWAKRECNHARVNQRKRQGFPASLTLDSLDLTEVAVQALHARNIFLAEDLIHVKLSAIEEELGDFVLQNLMSVLSKYAWGRRWIRGESPLHPYAAKKQLESRDHDDYVKQYV